MRTTFQIIEPLALDGNQTRIVTNAGTWQVTYNDVSGTGQGAGGIGGILAMRIDGVLYPSTTVTATS